MMHRNLAIMLGLCSGGLDLIDQHGRSVWTELLWGLQGCLQLRLLMLNILQVGLIEMYNIFLRLVVLLTLLKLKLMISRGDS